MKDRDIIKKRLTKGFEKIQKDNKFISENQIKRQNTLLNSANQIQNQANNEINDLALINLMSIVENKISYQFYIVVNKNENKFLCMLQKRIDNIMIHRLTDEQYFSSIKDYYYNVFIYDDADKYIQLSNAIRNYVSDMSIAKSVNISHFCMTNQNSLQNVASENLIKIEDIKSNCFYFINLFKQIKNTNQMRNQSRQQTHKRSQISN